MSLFTNPIGAKLALGAAVGAFLLGSVSAGLVTWKVRGALKDADFKEERDGWAKVKEKAAADLIAANAAAATETARLQGLIDAQAAEFHQKETQHEKAQADLRAAIADGRIRLSVKARCPAGGGAVSSNSGTSPVDHGEARAELDPETSGRIIGITQDGDDAIRQLNACVSYIEALHSTPR